MSDFTVLEDKMLKPFATLISCRDTVGSECVRGVTMSECVRQCREDPFCSCGYFLQPSNRRETSYCVPLNSALLKNMNILLNIYDHSDDPSAALWEKTAVFYDPKIYPPLTSENNFVLMEKDICSLQYVLHSTGATYYMQSDLSWKKDASGTALRVLFIDKYPQFYELANNVQIDSNFVLKVFAQPQIISIGSDGKLQLFSSLITDTEIRDFFMHLSSTTRDFKPASPLDVPILSFTTPFQIRAKDNEAAFLGPVPSAPSSDTITMGILPPSLHQQEEFPGYFMITRVDIQPNIFQVAKTLPARLTFLQNSVLPTPSTASWRWSLILLVISFLLLLLVFLLKRTKKL